MKTRVCLSLALAVSSFCLSQVARSEQATEWVVRARMTIPVVMGDNQLEASGRQPIDIINAPNTTSTYDTSSFVIPAVGNTVLDFGSLRVTGLFDNNLNICGENHDQRCNTAAIRVYTTGVAGAGIFNAAGGYGMPLVASFGGTDQVVGLEVANAINVQTIAIDPARHTVKLSDFGSEPMSYGFKSDFTDAGAGSYSTTIIFEYALAL